MGGERGERGVVAGLFGVRVRVRVRVSLTLVRVSLALVRVRVRVRVSLTLTLTLALSAALWPALKAACSGLKANVLYCSSNCSPLVKG